MRAFLSRDGALLDDPETLNVFYRLRPDWEDGVEFLSAWNEAGDMRHLEDYHLPTILHSFRRFMHEEEDGTE